MSLFAEHIVETNRTSLELRIFESKFRQPFLNESAHFARLTDAGKVAFHVGHETGHADLAEGFSQHLQTDGFARARGSGNQAVTVGHLPLNTERTVFTMRHIKSMFLIIHIFFIYNA